MTNTISDKALLKTYFETNDIPSQSQFDDVITSMVGMGTDSIVTIIDTGDYTVTKVQSGKTFVMRGAADTTFNLPATTGADIGVWYEFVNMTPNTLTIQASTNDTIEDSGPGATFFSGSTTDNSSSSSSEVGVSSSSSSSEVGETVGVYYSCKVKLMTSSWWHVLHGRGTWTSTEFV